MEKNTGFLSDINKKNPFVVPENYFDDFSMKLEQQIETLSKKQQKVSLFEKMKPMFYFAAMFVGIFVAFKVLQSTGKMEQNATPQTASLQTEKEIQDKDDPYCDVILNEIDEELLMELLAQK